MATSNLGRKTTEINDGLESIVVVKSLGDIPGGRTLNVEGVTDTVIKSGHIIVKKGNEYKPLGIENGAYKALGEGESYAGVLKASVLTADPRAAILTIGQINAAACPAPVTDAIKSGLSHIQFLNA